MTRRGRTTNSAVFPDGTSSAQRRALRQNLVHERCAPTNLGSATLRASAYTCPELGRTCQRPGAYQALDLPSIIGNERRWPDGRRERLTSTARGAE